jgi:predicted SAM-dependent methyltransferase
MRLFKKIVQNLKKPTTEVRRDTIASAFISGIGIELGALHNPLPVPIGAKVRYVDRMDKPKLYEQYPELRQHNLVDVDIVDNGETLLTFNDSSQDFIIANHFLEHCEDPIGTLNAFFRVLRIGGVVFLALPDKRYTFDKNRQRTSLTHLIRDHLDGPISSRFEHFREWAEFVEPHFGRVYASTEEIEHRAHELMNQNYSIHFHVWEPGDVHDMMRYCQNDLRIPLVIEYFLSKDDEMIIILRKKA